MSFIIKILYFQHYWKKLELNFYIIRQLLFCSCPIFSQKLQFLLNKTVKNEELVPCVEVLYVGRAKCFNIPFVLLWICKRAKNIFCFFFDHWDHWGWVEGGGVNAFNTNIDKGVPYFGFQCIFIKKNFNLPEGGGSYFIPPYPLPPCVSMVVVVTDLKNVNAFDSHVNVSQNKRYNWP